MVRISKLEEYLRKDEQTCASLERSGLLSLEAAPEEWDRAWAARSFQAPPLPSGFRGRFEVVTAGCVCLTWAWCARSKPGHTSPHHPHLQATFARLCRAGAEGVGPPLPTPLLISFGSCCQMCFWNDPNVKCGPCSRLNTTPNPQHKISVPQSRVHGPQVLLGRLTP